MLITWNRFTYQLIQFVIPSNLERLTITLDFVNIILTTKTSWLDIKLIKPMKLVQRHTHWHRYFVKSNICEYYIILYEFVGHLNNCAKSRTLFSNKLLNRHNSLSNTLIYLLLVFLLLLIKKEFVKKTWKKGARQKCWRKYYFVPCWCSASTNGPTQMEIILQNVN